MDSSLKYVEKKKSIAVILSAYSGHKYIATRVNSILNQEYNMDEYQLKLYIRDDSKYKDEKMDKYLRLLKADSLVVILSKNIEHT